MEKIIISCLESRVETNRSIYARFLLGPFRDDQAVTIATALRRSLLSKVKSIAITAIHIQGVTHEFSTIVGVRESVLDLSLNFQQIVLRAQPYQNEVKPKQSFGTVKRENTFNKKKEKVNAVKSLSGLESIFCLETESRPYKYVPYQDVTKKDKGSLRQNKVENQEMSTKVRHNKVSTIKTRSRDKKSEAFLTGSLNQTRYNSGPVNSSNETVRIGYLQVQGPAVIYANDLQLPVGVECVDPTQYIATLSTEGLLVVKFVIGEKSVSFEKNKEKLIANLSPDIQNGYQNIAPIKLLPKRNLGITSFQAKENRVFFPCKSFPTKTKFWKVTGTEKQKLKKVPLSSISIYRPTLLLATQIKRSFSSDASNLRSLRSFDSTISLRNTILLDPIFDSVFQVNYLIEKDDLYNQPRERILLELWTNGSIHPRQALHKASLSLISTFSIFRNVFHLDSL